MTNIIKKVIKNGTAYEIFGTAGANINSATATTAGVVKLGSDTSQSVAANSPSSTTGKTYPIQANGSGQMVVNVPWENTTYESKTAASGGTAVSLVTTGEKYTWNNQVNNTAYGSSWNGDTTHAPSKDAVYDKIEGLNIVIKSASAPSSPTAGTVWYDTTNNVLKVYNGSAWKTMQELLVSGTNIKTVNGNSILGSGDLPISGLPAGGTNGQIIMMVSGVATWVNPADVGFRLQASDTEIDVPYVWSGTEAQYQARQSYSDDTEYHTV